MIKLDLRYQRGDKLLTAEECGVATKVADVATIATASVGAGVAIAAAPAIMLPLIGITSGLHVLGHHLDHNKLAQQDNTPVVDASVTA